MDDSGVRRRSEKTDSWDFDQLRQQKLSKRRQKANANKPNANKMGNQPSYADGEEGYAARSRRTGSFCSDPRARASEADDASSTQATAAASETSEAAASASESANSSNNGAMAMLSNVWMALSPRSANRSNAAQAPSSASSAAPAAASSSTSRRVEQFYDVSTQSLGRGHYAVVCRGRCRRTGRAVAVKKIKRFLTDEKRLRAEISVLQRVQKHPNIVELIDVFETAREVHLVLELCTGGELFERLADKGPYSEADCVRHLRDMATAVAYLHSQGVVHRDLKPENILLSTPNEDDAVTKVADFGLAKIFTGTSLKTKCGTWGYSAPEMVSGSDVTFGYDFKVDSWSMGTILYILLCGFHPFDPNGTHSDSEMSACIKNCKYDFEDEAWATISDGAKDLVRHLLVLDPDARYSMAEVLAHPWITGSAPDKMPLSPTIHRDLARFREQSKQRAPFESFDDEVESTTDGWEAS